MHPVYLDMDTSIFERMSQLARECGAINLGQGFPDEQGPPDLIEAAARALIDKSNQYPPGAGLPELRHAVAEFYRSRRGLSLQADNIVITAGATEAIAAAILALVRPGDEVIVLTPAYDAYAPMVRRAGGVPVFVELAPPQFGYSRAAIEAAITPKTRALILNDPLNPAGTVASPDELAMLAQLCAEHGLFAICDEVWEDVRFDGIGHRSLLSFPGMEHRAVKIGSAGKIFGLTGWKVGWIAAAPEIAAVLARAHQFLTYATPPALQWAVAEGLLRPDAWFAGQRESWARSRERLKAGLTRAGYAVLPNAATWFVCIDLAASGAGLSDVEFSERAVREAGVASIPVSAFVESEARGPIVRLCFTKSDAVLDEAVERLARFRTELA